MNINELQQEILFSAQFTGIDSISHGLAAEFSRCCHSPRKNVVQVVMYDKQRNSDMMSAVPPLQHLCRRVGSHKTQPAPSAEDTTL